MSIKVTRVIGYSWDFVEHSITGFCLVKETSVSIELKKVASVQHGKSDACVIAAFPVWIWKKYFDRKKNRTFLM